MDRDRGRRKDSHKANTADTQSPQVNPIAVVSIEQFVELDLRGFTQWQKPWQGMQHHEQLDQQAQNSYNDNDNNKSSEQ